uniref:Uncharacterized protein n=1 Tax=Octopus bimaculoides TaxID=37653 RepID=A0A0L8FUU1_OCTBM
MSKHQKFYSGLPLNSKRLGKSRILLFLIRVLAFHIQMSHLNISKVFYQYAEE